MAISPSKAEAAFDTSPQDSILCSMRPRECAGLHLLAACLSRAVRQSRLLKIVASGHSELPERVFALHWSASPNSMGNFSEKADFPDSNSLDLALRHPTPDECVIIWTNTFESWGDSLPLPEYLNESLFLTTVPLAKDEGMSNWILVDKNLPPNQRPILCSCETFRKHSLTSNAVGNVDDNIVHGIASVFCAPGYRRRGYPVRMMKELAKTLPTWQLDASRCVGSILYSDIGKEYYGNLGWHPNPTNSHLTFEPRIAPKLSLGQEIVEGDLAELCKRDEIMVRKAMATPTNDVKMRVTIVPDLDHMLWHIRKEDFASRYLFGKVPPAKGAIAGSPGNQVWAIWTHRYYGPLDAEPRNNVLYILRLVVEADETATRLPLDAEKKFKGARYDEQVAYLKAVLQAAQAEAAEWKLDHVKLWDPTPLVQDMIMQSGIDHVVVEREEDSIASGMWYGENGQGSVAPLWVNNEHYAWL
ncbi:uncharacterized protein BDR25DRAFT_391249 [Lindgomyces ingoldianus]|uniref:Uncharacterized protein n=1 Tax=Lindgomyces ingoldianus TaxID=673940 RepID=A0ACB6R9H0_9PLEO|nr:uncharacterized protein BDR25DRAFT_391249 [Lindgomyces ingoldianus]KAF2475796.1 hypothetical protein BDR25DRAFT_391249 [Lindgomyces ingoldianus]